MESLVNASHVEQCYIIKRGNPEYETLNVINWDYVIWVQTLTGDDDFDNWFYELWLTSMSGGLYESLHENCHMMLSWKCVHEIKEIYNKSLNLIKSSI